jgi:hypothetical protein
MIAILFAFISLLLLSSSTLAQIVTIGVQPSEVVLDFYKSKNYSVELAFFNEFGDTAYYTLTPDACLSNLIKNYQKEVLVPRGASRLNPVKTLISIEGDNSGNKTCYLWVSAKPFNRTMGISPSMSVKFIIYQENSSAQPFLNRILIFIILAIIIIIATIIIIKWIK